MAQPSLSDRQVAEFGTLHEIAPRAYAFTQPDWGWGLNNCGVVVGEDSVLVVDSCLTEPRTRRLIAEVTKVTDKPMRYLVNSHHHGDHTFGNALFEGAVRIGHSYCRQKAVTEGLALVPYFRGVDWGEISVAPPDLCCDDRLTLHLGGVEARVIAVAPAHTMGDVIVWLPDAEVVYVGDLVFHGCTPVITDGSLAGIRSAMRALRELRPRVVVPGHGPVCGPVVFDEVLAYFDFVERAARQGFAKGWSPLEAARAVNLGRYAEWTDAERIVANIARAYSELRGEPVGTPLARKEIAPMMAEFAGHPLRCRA